MQEVTPDARAALLTSNLRINLVEIVEASGAVVASNDPDTLATRLYVTGGAVNVSGTAEVQRTCRLSLGDPTGELIPTTQSDLLHPLSGRRIRVRSGVRVHSRASLDDPIVITDHLWDLGLFDLFGSDTTRDGNTLSLSVEADDLGSRVRDNAWPQGRYRARENVNARLTWIINQAFPEAEYHWSPTSVVAPNKWFGIDGRNDRLADLRATANRAAKRLIVDAKGTFTTVDVVDPNDVAPVWTFSSQSDYSLMRVQRELSRRDTYNVVVLDCQSPETPDTGEERNFRVYAKDSNPKSPTWIGGPLGRRTWRERVTKPMKEVDAQAAVNARLRAMRRTSESVSFTSLVVPALEAFDVIALDDPETGTTDNHLLESFTWDYNSGVSSAQTQSRRVRV